VSAGVRLPVPPAIERLPTSTIRWWADDCVRHMITHAVAVIHLPRLQIAAKVASDPDARHLHRSRFRWAAVAAAILVSQDAGRTRSVHDRSPVRTSVDPAWVGGRIMPRGGAVPHDATLLDRVTRHRLCSPTSSHPAVSPARA